MPAKDSRVVAAYHTLLHSFGAQGWWPLLGEHGTMQYHHASRGVLSPQQSFEVCLGALLTQNTNWNNVIPALQALHSQGLIDADKASEASIARIASLIRPAGYYNQKARKISIFSRYVARKRNGLPEIWCMPVSHARKELLSLWGMGPETADSMLLYAGGKPVFVVDAYTRRIVSRLGWLSKEESADYDAVQAFLSQHAPRGVPAFQEFHALLVELAKRHCTKRSPRCSTCPLKNTCTYAKKGTRP